MRALAASHTSSRESQASRSNPGSPQGRVSLTPILALTLTLTPTQGSASPPREAAIEEAIHQAGHEPSAPPLAEPPTTGGETPGVGEVAGLEQGGEGPEEELGETAAWVKLKESLTPWQRVQVETRLVRQALTSSP